jgi:hypothetical protein
MEEEQPGKEYLSMHVHNVQLYVPCYCEFGFGYLCRERVSTMQRSQLPFDAGGYPQTPPLIGLPAAKGRSP